MIRFRQYFSNVLFILFSLLKNNDLKYFVLSWENCFIWGTIKWNIWGTSYSLGSAHKGKWFWFDFVHLVNLSKELASGYWGKGAAGCGDVSQGGGLVEIVTCWKVLMLHCRILQMHLWENEKKRNSGFVLFFKFLSKPWIYLGLWV